MSICCHCDAGGIENIIEVSKTDLPWIIPQLEVFEDSSRQLDAEQVFALPDVAWQKHQDSILRLGLSNSTWWFRATLKSTESVEQNLIVEIASTILDEVEFYVLVLLC